MQPFFPSFPPPSPSQGRPQSYLVLQSHGGKTRSDGRPCSRMCRSRFVNRMHTTMDCKGRRGDTGHVIDPPGMGISLSPISHVVACGGARDLDPKENIKFVPTWASRYGSPACHSRSKPVGPVTSPVRICSTEDRTDRGTHRVSHLNLPREFKKRPRIAI